MQIGKEEEEEATEGELEDFDDSSSVVTASTAISGDRAGGALVAGGPAGDLRDTLFGVDAEGTGTGDAAEVVHFVSSSERSARVRTRTGGGGRGGGLCSVVVLATVSLKGHHALPQTGHRNCF